MLVFGEVKLKSSFIIVFLLFVGIGAVLGFISGFTEGLFGIKDELSIVTMFLLIIGYVIIDQYLSKK